MLLFFKKEVGCGAKPHEKKGRRLILEKPQIVLGVTGSIAAYKAADIVSGLKKENCDIHVVMTEAATRFITPLTLQTLSKNKVTTEIFQEELPHDIKHISLAERADMLLVAPATANIIGKFACGVADDMLSTLFMAMQNIPVLIAPAMNTRMYTHPAVVDNMAILKRRGAFVIEPKEGLLACGLRGKGALADVQDIIAAVLKALRHE